MDPADQRSELLRAAAARGESLAALSRFLGRNDAYLQQYVQRGSPRLLAEADRGRLARFLGVAESLLGGPSAPAAPERVPLLGVQVSAGPGELVDDERAVASAGFDPAMLRALGIRAGAATIVRVAGDSMHPTLADGDHILVDTAARTIDTGRIHVLRHDGLVLTKRLERAGRSVRIVSDNPAYPALEVAGSSVAIIGRVVALGRRL